MQTNYHTHTTRCGHASGTDREILEAAVGVGITELGISEHLPGNFFDLDTKTGYRLRCDAIEEYVNTFTALRAEYSGRLTLFLGFEFGFYPEFFEQIMDQLTPYPIDYLILGQHSVGRFCDRDGYLEDDPERLRQYADRVTAGIETGCWSYVAHPDKLPYRTQDEAFRREFRRIIDACIAHDLPLEINGAALMKDSWFPCPEFFTLAAERGAKAIIGADAHDPGTVGDPVLYEKCRAFAAKVGISVVPQLRRRDPFRAYRAWKETAGRKI